MKTKMIIALALLALSTGADAAPGIALTDPKLIAELEWLTSLSPDDEESVYACYPEVKKNAPECVYWEEVKADAMQQDWLKRKVAEAVQAGKAANRKAVVQRETYVMPKASIAEPTKAEREHANKMALGIVIAVNALPVLGFIIFWGAIFCVLVAPTSRNRWN